MTEEPAVSLFDVLTEMETHSSERVILFVLFMVPKTQMIDLVV